MTMVCCRLKEHILNMIKMSTIDAFALSSEAEGIYNALEKLGIDSISVGSRLELEGVDCFKKSFDILLDSL
ncbi:hypothetical protein L1987_48971 [Smallanthus sonchifolius]|uniref:Uncharacterized protein n=1 Tax=Smallanthus sonchifolius TaxID=185202 RepID=A0ACB9FUI7_9ASTR|nr:hypothetical protein L1987_48971 [Smallanthus sonchifolius]